MAIYTGENVGIGNVGFLYIPTPDNSYTVCLFSFESEMDMLNLKDTGWVRLLFPRPGYYCFTRQDGTIVVRNSRLMGIM